MPIAALNNVEIYYEIHGKGEPLILIAGLSSDSQSWLPVLSELSAKYQVIIFDNRGVGRTKPKDSKINIQLMADDCIRLIKHLGLSSANVLGHSMGGFIALECAIRHTEYVSKLILAATSAYTSERNKHLLLDWCSYLDLEMDKNLWFKNLYYWILSDVFFCNNRNLEAAITYAKEYPYPQTDAAFKDQVNAINDYNCSEDLHKINHDTLVICGMNDKLFTSEESRKQLNAIPNVEFSFIENAAHSIHMEAPELFTKNVLKFLRK